MDAGFIMILPAFTAFRLISHRYNYVSRQVGCLQFRRPGNNAPAVGWLCMKINMAGIRSASLQSIVCDGFGTKSPPKSR